MLDALRPSNAHAAESRSGIEGARPARARCLRAPRGKRTNVTASPPCRSTKLEPRRSGCAVVDATAGTTRDPVDECLHASHGAAAHWRFVTTHPPASGGARPRELHGPVRDICILRP
ncbi:hypothetical protein GCM10020220_025950 [Nonomuraea rubra]